MLFGGKKTASAVVIDISSASVAGAFVRYPKDGNPVIDYSVRLPIETPHGEARSSLYMLRTLESVVNALINDGLPAFSREGGTHPDHVYVSIGAPWQETVVETVIIEPGKPFTFSNDMLNSAVHKGEPEKGKKWLGRELMATVLNGYETDAPQGKRTKRADIVLLSSSMEEDTLVLVGKAAKRLLPTKGVMCGSFDSLAYAVLHAQFPHEKEFILMRVSGDATSLLFGSQGRVVEADEAPVGLTSLEDVKGSGLRPLPVVDAVAPVGTTPKNEDAERAWVAGVTTALKEFTVRHALPRVLFLVADEQAMTTLKRLLDTPEVHSLWLSDEPLTVIPVVSKLLSSLIRHQGHADADIGIDLVTLYAQLMLDKKK